MPTNFEPKRFKQKLDIVEKHENRMHRLSIDRFLWRPDPFGAYANRNGMFISSI